jgi:hypothetical protein
LVILLLREGLFLVGLRMFYKNTFRQESGTVPGLNSLPHSPGGLISRWVGEVALRWSDATQNVLSWAVS